MIGFFANIFGYLLNFLYNLIQNYGLAMILFTIIIKIILLPISINQQKTMKKTSKIQDELKTLQFKNKNDPEALNRETMELYKRENISPLSGCISPIIQMILLFSIIYLVRSPLTYMKKIDPEIIKNYSEEVNTEADRKNAYTEIAIIREKSAEDERVNINMEFFGLDLSSVPSQDFSNWKNFVIPVLYVITTFLSMKITTNMQNKKEKTKAITDGSKEEKEEDMSEVMAQTNKNMTYMMPIIAVSASLVTPLGLALYWLTSNLLMIIERLILNKIFEQKEEEANV